MRTKFVAWFLLVVLVMTSVAPAFARGVSPLEPLVPPASIDSDGMVDETPQLWFVELTRLPTIDGTSALAISLEQAAFRSAAQRAGIALTEQFAFQRLWNGFSVYVRPADLIKLSGMPGVKAIYPVIDIEAPQDIPSSGPEMATALSMTGADIVQSELGYTGDGIKVAVMDTGIDYHHPDLGGCFGPGCRVFTGWDFVGDAFNADPTSASYNPVAVPDPDPDDCNGHGTHVSGIVGADGTITGVAPGVTFGAYRVFGCAGSTTADIMIAAMEMALADGMDILNMSIGSAYQWPQYPTAAAADRLVNSGMVVVASIGNNGTNGLYAAGAPGLGNKVIGTASFDNTHVALSTFTISPDDTQIGYGGATAAPVAPTSGTFEMARTGTSSSTADACAALPAGSLAGKVVLIRRGTCSFHIKANNAQAAGAAGVVLYNNAPGRFSPTVAGTPAITIPVVAISDTEGVLIDSRLASGPVFMTWTEMYGSFPNPTGGLISSFSSYGLSPDLALKPDIGAPGGSIRSTYPLESGGFATISGTSMASPHVAGAVALLLEARPQIPAGLVRDILQNSADPKVWSGNPGLGYLDLVHRQGAGMLDIDDAILAETIITPGKLALGEGEAGATTHTMLLRNNGKDDVTYWISSISAVGSAGVINPSFSLTDEVVAFSSDSVTVPAQGSVTVEVTITPASGPVNGQYGGYVVFTPEGGGAPLSVPYAGFVGDYQGIQVLTSGGNGFPWLARLSAGTYTNQPSGATFTLVGEDIPYILVHLDHQARALKLEVLSASTGRPLVRILEENFMPRNSTPTGFFAFAWDGSAATPGKTMPLPDGSYVIRLTVLKALGDKSNPAHTETWISPVITIDRP